MTLLSRRAWIQLSAGALTAAALPLRAQNRPLKMLLNSGYSGANSFFTLAQDKGTSTRLASMSPSRRGWAPVPLRSG